jgi:hypothetical protein
MALIDDLTPENRAGLRKCIARLPPEHAARLRSWAAKAREPVEAVFLKALVFGFLAQPPEVRLKQMRESEIFASFDDGELEHVVSLFDRWIKQTKRKPRISSN